MALTPRGLMVELQVIKNILGVKFNAFLDKLTLKYKPKKGMTKIIKMYSFERICLANRPPATYLVLPRKLAHSLPIMNISIKYELPELRPIINPLELGITLYNNQSLVSEYLYYLLCDRILKGTGCAVINMGAGQGKTFLTAGLCMRFKLKTLIIVPTVYLAGQAHRDLSLCFAGANIVQHGKKPKTDRKKKGERAIAELEQHKDKTPDIYIIVINSALNQDDTFFQQFSMVIYDEIHTYCTNIRKEIFRKVIPLAIGMSATTDDRNDGFDDVFKKELAIDDVIHVDQLPGWEKIDEEFKTDVSIIYYNGPPSHTKLMKHEDTDNVMCCMMHQQFMEDEYRMKLVISEIVRLYRAGHNIFVFCEEREGVQAISELLGALVEDNVDTPELSSKELGNFMGGIKDKEADRIRVEARILITTYGYSGTGISLPRMTAIVFATSRRSNMKQILARILRKGGDSTIKREISDIVDNRTFIRNQLADRLQAYDFYKMNVSRRKVNYEDCSRLLISEEKGRQ